MTRSTGSALLLGSILIGLFVSACVTVTSDVDGTLLPTQSPQATTVEETAGAAIAPPTAAAASPAVAAEETARAAIESPAADAESPAAEAESPGVEPEPTPRGPSRPPDDGLIGYISLDEGTPFARSVSVSVRTAVEQQGLRLAACDSALTRSGALACGRQLGQAGIGGLISFQAFPDVAAEICEAVGGVATVGIAFDQGPCEVSRVRLDQSESGRVAGEALGRFASEQWDCQFDAYLSLEARAAVPDAAARMAGYREGFASECPIAPDAIEALPGADRVATAQTQLANVLGDLDGSRIVVVGLNEDAIIGALRAAKAAGREADLFYSGQGADPSIRQTIACDPQYVASVAHFPERYGAFALPTLLDAMAGLDAPPIIDAPLELVTAENVHRLFPDTPACGG